jgi:hypothetical protein
MYHLTNLSFAGTAIVTQPMFRLPLLVLAGSLVLAGQSNASDTQATNIHLANADPVPDNKVRVERPAPTVPVVIALGDHASVLTYWVDEPDGFHVISTVETVSPGVVDGQDHHAIVRFSTTIQPDEMQNDFRARTLWFFSARDAHPSAGRPSRGARNRGRASR